MEYINGTTGYIDTTVTGLSSDSIFLDFELTSLPIFSSDDDGYLLLGSFGGSISFRSVSRYNGSTDGAFSITPYAFGDYLEKVVLDTSRHSYLYALPYLTDGGSFVNLKASDSILLLLWVIRGINTLTGESYVTYKDLSFVRLYRFALVGVGGSLRHDLLPCTHPEGAVGLYDVIEGEFYPRLQANLLSPRFEYNEFNGTFYKSFVGFDLSYPAASDIAFTYYDSSDDSYSPTVYSGTISKGSTSWSRGNSGFAQTPVIKSVTPKSDLFYFYGE